jgi:hypothetical protein
VADDALQRVLQRRGLVPGLEPATPSLPPRDITAPVAPVQEQPDLIEAARTLRETGRETFALDAGGNADARAAAYTEAVRNRPDPVAPDIDLLEQARRSLTPKRVTADGRPDPVAETWESSLDKRAVGGSKTLGVVKDVLTAPAEMGMALGEAGARKAASLLGYDVSDAKSVPEIIGLNTTTPRGVGEAADDGDITVPEEAEGVATENTALAVLRMAGTLIPAFTTETLGRVPVPAMPGSSLDAETAAIRGDDNWTNLSEIFTGAPTGAQQRIRRDNPVADWTQGILERIEDGRSLEGDFALAAKNQLGPEYESAGWWTGLVVDTLTNWEGALLKGPALVGRAAQTAAELDAAKGIAPGKYSSSSAWAAISGNEVDVMEALGGRLADELEAGKITVADLPDYWRVRLDEVAVNEYDRTFRELAEGEGLEAGAAQGTDAAFQKGVDDIEAARAERAAADPAAPPEAVPAPVVPPPRPARSVDPKEVELDEALGRVDLELAASRKRLLEAQTWNPPTLPKDGPGSPSYERALRLEAEADLARAEEAFAEAERLDREAMQVPPHMPGSTLVPKGWGSYDEAARSGWGAQAERFDRILAERKGRLAKLDEAKETYQRTLAESQERGTVRPQVRPTEKVGAKEAALQLQLSKKREQLSKERAQLAKDLERAHNEQLDALEAKAAAKNKEAAQLRLAGKRKQGTPGIDKGSFAERPVEMASGQAMDRRPRLPVLSKDGIAVRVHTQAEFIRAVIAEMKKPDAHPLGYNIGPSVGFDRLDDARRQSIDDVKYTLRNKAGDVIGNETTFAKVLERALSRQMDGDTVWYDGTRRKVAGWGSKARTGTKEPIFSADYWFASDVERAMIRQARETDARAIPVRLRQLMAERALRQAKRGIGSKLLDMTTGAPARSGVPAKGSAADVIRKVAALHATDLVGSDVLKQLPGGALVSPRDHRKILVKADALTGMNSDQAAALIKAGGVLAPDVVKQLQRVLPSFEGPLTPRSWTAVHHEAVRQVAGFQADVRYRVRGILPLGEQIIRFASDFHVQRFKLGRWRRWAQEHLPTPVQWLGKGFTGDVTARMPPLVKASFKALKTTLERNADELEKLIREEIKGGRRGDSAESILMSIIQRTPIVRSDALDVADLVTTTPTSVAKARTLDFLRQTWTGKRPDWLDNPVDIIAVAGARTWARDARIAAADVARDWVHANAVAAGMPAGPGTDLAGQLAQLDEAALLPVYREVMFLGELGGEATTAMKAKLGIGDVTGPDALISFLLRIRAKEAIAETVTKLVDEGAILRAGDVRTPALRAVLNDQYRDLVDGRWVYRHTESQTSWAMNRLRDWGIEPGAGNSMTDMRIANQAVQVPAFLADELSSLIASGALDGSRLEGMSMAVLSSKVMRVFKESVTHGVLAPQPAYFLGQFMGMLPTLVTTRGPLGAAKVLATPLFLNPLFVGELVRRSDGRAVPLTRTRSPDALVLRTADGDLYGVDELMDVAKTHGLHETRPAFELQRSIQQTLTENERVWWDPRRIGKPFKWWQEVIRRYAGAVDINARMSVFVDEVKKGADPQTAALTAKEAVLDFRNLTRFEQRYMRLGITFYAFLRKNADAHVKALLTNPARVLGQMRLAHASITNSGLSSIELGAMSDQDIGRYSFYNDEQVVDSNGNTHPLFRLNRITSTPISVVEFLMQQRMLLAPLTWDDQGTQDLLGSMTPLLQVLAVSMLGRKLDRSFDSAGANRIPPVLLDGWWGDLVRDTYGIGWEELTPTDDPAIQDDDATLEAGRPARWVAGAGTAYNGTGDPKAWQEEKRKLWQLTVLWLSRPLGQAQLAREAGVLPSVLGESDPAPGMDRWDAQRDLLLGTKTRPVVTESEVIRRFGATKERDMRNAAQELRIRK